MSRNNSLFDLDSDDVLKVILGKIRASLAAVLAGCFLIIYCLNAMDELKPGHVAVKTNLITGNADVIQETGLLMDFGLIHRVVTLSTAPIEFRMQGDEDGDLLNGKELSIRCKDGANIHFKDFTLVAELIPEKAQIALDHAWGTEGYLRWLKPHIRSILRDEFGTEDTLTMSDPSSYKGASDRGKALLNKALNPHGIRVTNIITPRPKFSPEYEAAIQARVTTFNQIDVIASELETVQTRRVRELAVVDQTQNRKLQEKRASYESSLAGAVAGQAETKQNADSFRIGKIASGQAAFSAAEQEALQLEGQLTAQLGAKRAQILAFRTQPKERVMQAIAERWAGTIIHVQPYANDASRSHIDLNQ